MRSLEGVALAMGFPLPSALKSASQVQSNYICAHSLVSPSTVTSSVSWPIELFHEISTIALVKLVAPQTENLLCVR